MILTRHKGTANELAAMVWLLSNGYEVFENISVHGPIDIVAIKNNEILYLDAKSSISGAKLTLEQKKLGVKFIAPLKSGQFSIFLPAYIDVCYCEKCGKICPGNRKRKFCSRLCRSRTHAGRKKHDLLTTNLPTITARAFHLNGSARKAL